MASNLVYMLVAALFIVNTQFCHGWQRQETPISPSVIVQGKVCCNTCSNPGPSDSSYFIPGASVAVECSFNRKIATAVRVEGETDEMGEFKIEIPSLFHSKPERCSAQLIRSPHASCNVPAIATSPNFNFSADLDGVQTFSAGSLSYRPHIVPSACYTDSDSDIFFVHGREALQKDERSKDAGPSPRLPTIPSLPNLKSPPSPPLRLPTPPGLVPPFPGNLPPPQLSFPLLPPLTLPTPPDLVPPFPGIPPLPHLSFPPLPPTGIPIPKPPPLPISIPPLPLLAPPSPSK